MKRTHKHVYQSLNLSDYIYIVADQVAGQDVNSDLYDSQAPVSLHDVARNTQICFETGGWKGLGTMTQAGFLKNKYLTSPER